MKDINSRTSIGALFIILETLKPVVRNNRVLVKLYCICLNGILYSCGNAEMHSLTWKDVHSTMCEKSLVYCDIYSAVKNWPIEEVWKGNKQK